jgi:hypothetical protein
VRRVQSPGFSAGALVYAGPVKVGEHHVLSRTEGGRFLLQTNPPSAFTPQRAGQETRPKSVAYQNPHLGVGDSQPNCMRRFRRFARRIIRVTLARSVRGALPVVWFISYKHPLRPDEAGVKFVYDETEATAEKLRLEARGYVVGSVAQSPHASART